MRTTAKFLTASATLFLAFATPAWADLRSDLHNAEYLDTQFVKDETDAVARASARWAKELNGHDPMKVAALYDPNNFILYATFTTKINTPEELVKYFTNLMKKERSESRL